MAAPVTIKRRKMTIKKPAPGKPVGEEGAQDVNTEVSDEPFPDEPSSEPFTAQPPVAVQAKPAYTFYAILAIFTTLFFIGLLTIQWIEWTDYIPHFPRPIQTERIVN